MHEIPWLAELVAAKKGEDCATTVSWICSKVSFAILSRLYSVLEGQEQLEECSVRSNVQEVDFELDRCLAKI